MRTKLFGFVLLVVLTGCVSTKMTRSPTGGEIQARTPNLEAAAYKRLTLGLQYLAKGRLERAKFNLDRALQHAPNNPDVLVGLAYYFQKVKENALAEKYYKYSLDKAPKNGDNINSYASFLCEQGEYKKANKLFTKAIGLADYAGAGGSYENMGTCTKRQGKNKLAKNFFLKALNYNANSSKSLLELADLSFQEKSFLEARAFLRQYFQVSTPGARALWLGIQIERLLGDKDAKASYQLQLTGRFPNSKETEIYLKSLHQ